MREISLNGYIDEEVWFGDEITPDSLHETLYEPGADLSEDVHIRLNSYGGSCNAAVRMHDDLVAYPGDVTISISGTAASAATVLAMAADVLEMSPGSLFMIHDPSTLAFGNEADLMDAINMLRACKESIINVYQKRTHAGRDQIAKMMRDTTWMDAEAALAYGFIDRVTESNPGCTIINSAAARDVAEKKVQLWRDRHIALLTTKKGVADNRKEDKPHDQQAASIRESAAETRITEARVTPAPEASPPDPADPPVDTGKTEAPEGRAADEPQANEEHTEPQDSGIPVSQLHKRLALIMPKEAKNKEVRI